MYVLRGLAAGLFVSACTVGIVTAPVQAQKPPASGQAPQTAPPPSAEVRTTTVPASPAALARTASGALLSPGYSLGTTLHLGGANWTTPTDGFSPQYTGFRYAERSGLLTTFLSLIAMRSLLYAAAGAPSSSHTTSRSETVTRNGRNYIETTYETTYVYNNMNERVAMVEMANEMSFSDVAIQGSSFEIEVLTRDVVSDLGDGYGYRLGILFPVVVRPYFQLELGWGSSKIMTLDEERGLAWESVSRGMPVRMHFPLLRYLSLHAGFDANLASFFGDGPRRGTIDGTSYTIREVRRWPIYVGASAYVWRFHLGAELLTTRPEDLDFGYSFTLAFRF